MRFTVRITVSALLLCTCTYSTLSIEVCALYASLIMRYTGSMNSIASVMQYMYVYNITIVFVILYQLKCVLSALLCIIYNALHWQYDNTASVMQYIYV